MPWTRGCMGVLVVVKCSTRGGWKLVISDAREVAISDDVIIRAAIVIEAHSKSEIDLHKQLFVYLEQNSLSGYPQVSSRSTAMAFYDYDLMATI